jgi:uncharacterized Rmd1/YagE family protein
MDCRAYCTATSYKIKPLFDSFRDRFKSTSFKELIHLEFPLGNENYGDIFLFAYGAAVFWGIPLDQEQSFLKELKEFEENPLNEIETDMFTFSFSDNYKIVEDEIFLPDREMLSRLAISHAIAQSVKLSTFESAIQNTYNLSKEIPLTLSRKGKVSLSKKEIRRKMGELFIERSSINLHADVLDTPEFFWEYPELEHLYKVTANYLDIKTRVEVLNQRLDVVHELFQMLGTELNNQHATTLEFTIVLLIVIEVILTLLKDVFKIL